MRESDAEWRRSVESRIEKSFGIRANADTVSRIIEYVARRGGTDIGDAALAILNEDPRTFVRLVTVNETYFFREHAHFALLLNKIVPDLAREGRPIRLASCATSVGCEAYSAAMILMDCRSRYGGFPFEIDAFDINPENIEAARRGVYGPNAFREDGNRFISLIQKYALPHGDGFEMAESLRNAIRFFPHNLMEGMPSGAFDCVFFRNALIYLTEEARTAILNSIAEALVPGGYFIVGTSETPVVDHPLLKTFFEDDVFYFRKLSSAGPRLPRVRSEAVAEPETAYLPQPPAAPILPRAPRRKIDLDRIIELVKEADHPPAAGAARLGSTPPDERSTDEEIDALINEALVLVFSLIHTGKIEEARSLLARLEPRHRHELIFFLSGEIFRYTEGGERADYCYRESLRENSRFWPAAYRLAEGAGESSETGRPYAIERAVRSIERGRALGYECFIGGFSPDYYLGLLTKRLDGKAR